MRHGSQVRPVVTTRTQRPKPVYVVNVGGNGAHDLRQCRTFVALAIRMRAQISETRSLPLRVICALASGLIPGPAQCGSLGLALPAPTAPCQLRTPRGRADATTCACHAMHPLYRANRVLIAVVGALAVGKARPTPSALCRAAGRSATRCSRIRQSSHQPQVHSRLNVDAPQCVAVRSLENLDPRIFEQ